MQINSGTLNAKKINLDSFKNLPPRPIFCADCKELIGSWDRKSTIDKMIRCKCGKYNLYHVDTGETEITNKPQRTCASGVTFH